MVTHSTETNPGATFTSHAEWFAAYLRHADNKKILVETTLAELQSTYADFWQNRIADPSYPFTVLFVGAGNGLFEVPFSQALIESKGAPINIDCVDPSAEMQKEFMANAENAQLPIERIDYHLNGFGDQQMSALEEADLAVSAHSWYYIHQASEKIDRENDPLVLFRKTIKPGGIGLIVLHSATSDNFAVRFLLTPQVHPGTQELSGEAVVKRLAALGIESRSEIVDTHTDISSCFQQGRFQPTAEGELILSFILRDNYAQQPLQIQQQLRDELTRIVEKNTSDEHPQAFGQQMMYFRDLYIWIKG